MTKQFQKVAMAMVLMTGFGVAGAARAEDYSKIIARVPFEFEVGGKTMPAGTYEMSPVNSSGTVRFRAYNEAGGMFLAAHASAKLSGATQAYFRFQKYGNRVFLRGLYDGQSICREMFPGKVERELMARGSASGEPAVILASVR